MLRVEETENKERNRIEDINLEAEEVAKERQGKTDLTKRGRE
jgi:hypothetical protein